MTRVGPIMVGKKSLCSAWSNSDCMPLPSYNYKNKADMPKRQTNGGPCKFSVWLDPTQLASAARCHSTATPEKRRWAEEKPVRHLISHVWEWDLRKDLSFVLFQAESRLFPLDATSPLPYVLQNLLGWFHRPQLPRRFLFDSHPSLHRHVHKTRTIKHVHSSQNKL